MGKVEMVTGIRNGKIKNSKTKKKSRNDARKLGMRDI